MFSCLQISFCQKMSSRILFHSKHLNCLPHRKWHRSLINVLPGRWSWSVTTGVKIKFFLNEMKSSSASSSSWSFHAHGALTCITTLGQYASRHTTTETTVPLAISEQQKQSDIKNRRTLCPPVYCILPSSCSVSPEYNYIWPSTG